MMKAMKIAAMNAAAIISVKRRSVAVMPRSGTVGSWRIGWG
jgi:hypothetical protein